MGFLLFVARRGPSEGERRAQAFVYNRPPLPAARIPNVSYYERHVFFCCNQREPDAQCCNNHGAQGVRDYAKSRVKALKLSGEGKVRINTAGCLDRCDEGPVLVIYPEAVWYTYVDREDIDEIITEHLENGRIVDRLRI